MSEIHVVLLPGQPGNTTKKHLVVTVTEYVQVTLGEKDKYTFVLEYPTIDEAFTKRDNLNRKKEPQPHITEEPPAQDETPPDLLDLRKTETVA